VLNGISSGSFSGDDDSGHGTFVAGIIAGRGWGQRGAVPAGSYVGVAPNVNIISVKVSNSNGMAYVSDVVAAIEWVTEHRKEHNIRVLNLSLASTVAGSYLTDMFDAAVELAWFQGLVVVVAAGNGGPNAGITAPANDPFVITVGATDDMGTATTTDDAVAPFSSYGKTVDGIAKPDVVAPGRNIVSTLSSPLAPLARQFPNRVLGSGNYIRLSGTSAAAPVVSGVVAQLLEARPNLTPGQVKWLLTHTALPVTGPGTGAGYPQVGAAVDFAGKPGTTDTRTPNLYLQVAYAKQMGQTWNSDSWNNLSWQDVSRDTVSWNTVSWNNVSWNNVSWNNVSWNSVSWNNVSWNNVSWNNVAFLPAI
jgi:serine protease AprX